MSETFPSTFICDADEGATVFLRCSNAVRVEHKGFDSDEEAEAEPTESEVAKPVGLSTIIHFD